MVPRAASRPEVVLTVDGARPRARVWDPFLTEHDRAAIAASPTPRKGAGRRPALIMCDLYRAAFGDRPLPLLESIREWPSSCGLAGWNALPHIQALLAEARSARIPVIYLKGMEGVPSWNEGTARSVRRRPPHPDRFRIVDEVAPVDGEIVLGKVAPSGFSGTPLVQVLNQFGADTLIVAGEATSGCVRATVVDARSNRFRVLVPEDCVFDRHEAPHAINLFDMNEKYADVIPLDEVLAYLRGIGAAEG